MTIDLDTVADLDQGFDNVQTLRDILDSLLRFQAHCAGDLRIVKALQEQTPSCCAFSTSGLASYSSQLSDYIECAMVLIRRINNLVDLVRPKFCSSLHHHSSSVVDLRIDFEKPALSIKRQQEYGEPYEKDDGYC